ncbi:unnamed protein product [Rotaria sp. Silwood1]|nr:unnamed protein product [Rotaria sp. Silwood1]CAF4855191.1 unnamed protein product [Rotaria sp. Silwood1]
MTTQYGYLKFGDNVSDSNTRLSQYIRLALQTNAKTVVKFMQHGWRLPTPDLIISVTGSGKECNISAHLRKTFQRGLVAAAATTIESWWCILGGYFYCTSINILGNSGGFSLIINRGDIVGCDFGGFSLIINRGDSAGCDLIFLVVRVAVEMTNIYFANKNLFIKINPPNIPKPSFVWNYFGYLYKTPNEPVDKEHVYCKICFDKLKDDQPDVNFFSIKNLIGIYSNISGTGNMKNHLLSVHQVKESQQTKVTNQHILSMFSRNHHSTKPSQLKQQLGHQLTLMCCRDLLPFSIVENEGNLTTLPFDESHTGEAIKDLVLLVLHEFNINSNNIIVVSDQGPNMCKAWKLLNVIHTFCIGHGIHNWLMKDCFPHMNLVPDLLDKVQMIINKLRYRQHELENEFFRYNEMINQNLFISLNKAGEILDADIALSNIDVENIQTLNDDVIINNVEESFLSNDLQFNSKQIQSSTISNNLLLINNKNSERFHTLKKRVLTRWNTILIMLRSYIDNVSGIEIILHRLKYFDLILSAAENQIIRDLVEFLSLLESTTTILSASKSYTTMNLYLLLRIEIESILNITDIESPVVRELKILLFENMNKRYPVLPLNICGFLLDPSQLKIDISRYLNQNRTTKEKILFEMIKKFKIHPLPQASTTTENISTSASSSHSIAPTTTSSSTMKRCLSVENLSEPAQNLKRLRENLIQKHTPNSVLVVDPIADEIEKYLKLDVNCDDVLKFWRSSEDNFPHLKVLAQIVLAIPATSTPSEQVFSTTGLILNAKRTMLSPENVGKIQVIHDNYNLFKPT